MLVLVFSGEEIISQCKEFCMLFLKGNTIMSDKRLQRFATRPIASVGPLLPEGAGPATEKNLMIYVTQANLILNLVVEINDNGNMRSSFIFFKFIFN